MVGCGESLSVLREFIVLPNCMVMCNGLNICFPLKIHVLKP